MHIGCTNCREEMNRIAMVSFDWRRTKDPLLALGHASISAALRSGLDTIHSTSITDITSNLALTPASVAVSLTVQQLLKLNPGMIGFGTYVWNDACVQETLTALRRSGWKDTAVLEDPQVFYAPRGTLEQLYPGNSVDYFIRGYGEQAMVTLAKRIFEGGHPDVSSGNNKNMPCSIPGVHIYGDKVDKGGQAISGANFCDDSSSGNNAFTVSWLHDLAVLDPTFNVGQRSVDILTMLKLSGYQGKLALQCRFELITPDFIKASHALKESGCDVTLEFGVQTVVDQEAKAGSPASRKMQSCLNWCKHELQPTKLGSWPLMLLRGTELYIQRDLLGLVEEVVTVEMLRRNGVPEHRVVAGLPHVTSSPSFTRKEWIQMARTNDPKLGHASPSSTESQ
ncbi:hypothetical protein BDR26DRAFT_981626 [Obelidium mucronatum]|nr:hypothetical protein BDR26DRAFT_981626 [Obelidium mucronatum]